MISPLVFLNFLLCNWAACAVMNKGGVPYAISNPPGSTPNWSGTAGR